MSSGEWTLDPESEYKYLVPWLATEPDEGAKKRVLRYLAEILSEPRRERLEDEPGVYSAEVPRTGGVGIIWLVDEQKRVVVLANVGRIRP